MDYLVRVYCGTQMIEQEIAPNQSFTVGSGDDDSISLSKDLLPRKCFTLALTDRGWTAAGKDKKYSQLYRDAGSPYAFRDRMLVDRDNRLAITVYCTSPDFGHQVSIESAAGFTLGRKDDMDVTIRDKSVSGKHIRFARNGSRWDFEDLNSSNGVYLNGQLVKKGTVGPKDVLSAGFVQLVLEDKWLHATSQAQVISHLTAAEPRPRRGIEDISQDYPCEFRQSPRLLEAVPHQQFNLEHAPSIGGKPEINWTSVLLGPLLTTGAMLAVSLLVGGPMSMMVFSVPMALTGVIMSVVNYRGQIKKYNSTQDLRLDKYGDYLSQQEAAIQACLQEQRRILTQIYPSCSQCCTIAAGPDRTLWDRRSIDTDFMSLRVGSGSIPAAVDIRTPHMGLSLEHDQLNDRPGQIADRYQKVENCPVWMDFGQHPSCGVIGSRPDVCRLGRDLIVQAATHHSYDDLRIVVLCDKSEREQWAFTRWLPHNFDDTHTQRYYADTPETARNLLASIAETVSQRAQELNSHSGAAPLSTPFYLLICANMDLINTHPIMKLLAANDPALGVGAVYLTGRIAQLPTDSHYIIDLGVKPSVIYQRENSADRQEFTLDSMQAGQYEQFARSLAPLRMDLDRKDTALPTGISFMQGFGVQRPNLLPIAKAWAAPRPEKSMAVPIGVTSSGAPFLFDIHEKAAGPHGLVAGMTGSGKSEMIQSWILSMAVHFPPDAVSFVLIDFKGTGLLLPFRNLPHLAGSISDLDDSIGRNLIALQNELTRRKELLDKYNVSSIGEYLKLLHSGKASEPLPYLFIVIDEFAEFRLRFPDFMSVINSVFAIGRTLGVHMILLTQKPASVVDDKMMANTRFRWCLKVANSGDSRDMLGHPDAVRITNPGRAYVQVGEDEVYELVQSYWSGAPYNPFRPLDIQRSTKISVVDPYGRRLCYEPEKTTGYRSEKKEIDAVVEYLDSYCRENQISRARAIWTDKLPDVLYLRDVMQIAFDGEHWSEPDGELKAAVGLIDDPRSQSQYPLYFDFNKSGSVAVYGAPGTGKTTLLHTVVTSLALTYSPDRVHMYLMDFGGGSLNIFRKLPHVGGVAISGDDEKVERLITLLSKELNRRKKLLLEQGLLNYRSYEEVTGQVLPAIVVVLDNYTPVPDLYPELADFLPTLAQEGGNFGIYLVISGGGANALPYHITQNIKACVALQMTDPSDYAMLVGRLDGLTIASAPGRGLVRGKPPLEFQTALPAKGSTESERVSAIRQLAELMADKWEGEAAGAIPVLPDKVCSRNYPCEQLLVGLERESFQPCTLDILKQQFLTVSIQGSCPGAADSLRSQLEEKLPGAHIIEFSGPQDAKQFQTQLASIIPILGSRKEEFDAGHFVPEENAPIVVFIRDHGACFQSCDDLSIKRLAQIVTLGQGLNVLLISVGQSQDLQKLHSGGEIFTVQLIRKSAALLIGGSIQSHALFPTDLPFSEQMAEGAQNQGALIRSGETALIKIVEE